MVKETPAPKTLLEAIRYFSDPERCHEFMVSIRWPKGVACPSCGRKDVRYISTRRLWECKGAHPKRQFSAKVGTIFEDSPIGLDKWFAAVWMIANDKNGVSSYEVHRALGVTQKTAWFMLHRIRLAMQTGTFRKMKGRVEVDETFVGGKVSNMHKGRRKMIGSHYGRTIVMGLLQRGGKVRAQVVPDVSAKELLPVINRNVAEGSEVITDSWAAYRRVPEGNYAHAFVDHTEEYVRGHVHTNGIENFWSLLKRSLHGTYVAVRPFQLFRYVDEQAFRYNERKRTDSGRFLKVLGGLMGKRLTYKTLTGHAGA